MPKCHAATPLTKQRLCPNKDLNYKRELIKCTEPPRLNTPTCLRTTPLPSSAIISETDYCKNRLDKNDLVNYGKIRDIKTRTQLYSYDYMSRNGMRADETAAAGGLGGSSVPCCKKIASLIRDPNEFYYLDKLYNSSAASSPSVSCKSSTRARICAHPAPLPDFQRARTNTTTTAAAADLARSSRISSRDCRPSQVSFLDDHRIGSYCCSRQTSPQTGLNLPKNLSFSAGSLCDASYAPYTNYLEIGIFWY